MGLTSSSTSASSRLPLVGDGKFSVGCADIMVKGEGDGDSGIFARIFYPSSLKDPSLLNDVPETEAARQPTEYPIWRPRREYVDGLAGYRQMSPMKMHFFFDWVVGERRLAAGWHEPLYSSNAVSKPLPVKEDQNRDVVNNEIPIASSKHISEEKYPVVIFSHGISGNRLCYTTFCASLASYGFVVAALEHRDKSSSWTYYLEYDQDSKMFSVEKPLLMTTYPDGEQEFKARNQQLHKRVTECVRALHVLEELNLGQCDYEDKQLKGGKIIHGHNFDWSQFKNRLDLTNAVVMGHSFGGAAAIAAAAFSTDFVASVVLDGWLFPIENDLYSKTTQPSLLLNASKWQWAENVRRMLRMDPSSEKIMLTLKDIVHQTFSDFAFLVPGYLGKTFALQGELDPSYAIGAILDITVTFLRESFRSRKAIEGVRELVKKYEDFVIEGTDIDLEADLKKKEAPADSNTSNI